MKTLYIALSLLAAAAAFASDTGDKEDHVRFEQREGHGTDNDAVWYTKLDTLREPEDRHEVEHPERIWTNEFDTVITNAAFTVTNNYIRWQHGWTRLDDPGTFKLAFFHNHAKGEVNSDNSRSTGHINFLGKVTQGVVAGIVAGNSPHQGGEAVLGRGTKAAAESAGYIAPPEQEIP